LNNYLKKSRVLLNNTFKDERSKVTGLWPLPSLINHHCIGNAARFCIDDTMFITTSKNLKANDEILIGYTSKFIPYRERIDCCSSFGFRCNCSLCQLYQSETMENIIGRMKLTNYFKTEVVPEIRMQSDFAIRLLEMNIYETKRTYEPNNPLHLELFTPFTGLAILYQKAEKDFEALKTYIECLNCTGFKTKFELKKTKLCKKNVFDFVIHDDETLEHEYIDLFMHISHLAFKLGYDSVARQCLALSRLTAKIHSGSTIDDHTNEFKSKGVSTNLLKYKDKIKFK